MYDELESPRAPYDGRGEYAGFASREPYDGRGEYAGRLSRDPYEDPPSRAGADDPPVNDPRFGTNVSALPFLVPRPVRPIR